VGGRRFAGLVSRSSGEGSPEELADLAEVPVDELQRLVVRLEQEMRLAAAELRYEEAALLRDEIAELRLALAESADLPGGTDGAGGLAVPVPSA
jgi:excinuclease UvrABC helicase subunit UvrB